MTPSLHPSLHPSISLSIYLSLSLSLSLYSRVVLVEVWVVAVIYIKKIEPLQIRPAGGLVFA